jgi:tol-pal system protein YbgF
LLLLLCFAGGQAHAGLFTDEEMHKKVTQLEARIAKLEDTDKQRTQVLLDLQAQIETLNGVLRTLRGQNEQMAHDLQDAEKRQKDFYVDLDSRMRRVEEAMASAASAAAAAATTTAAIPVDTAAENRDYDAAYALFKDNKQLKSIAAFQDFLKKYPSSALAPNAYFWMGVSYSALKDYKAAITNYQTVVDKYPTSQKAPTAMMSIATSYQELNDVGSAKKTLKKLIAAYPDTDMAARAKKRLAQLK